jgi:hypothetical protein
MADLHKFASSEFAIAQYIFLMIVFELKVDRLCAEKVAGRPARCVNRQNIAQRGRSFNCPLFAQSRTAKFLSLLASTP